MLLALDTSTTQIGLALYDGTQVLAEKHWRGRLRHTQTLAPAAQELLQAAGLPLEALSAVAVALGPGSFTSLRVGLAFAKGLILARGLPLIGIPTLDTTAAALPPDEHRLLLAVLQAGRGRLALQTYRVHAQTWQPQETEPRGTTLSALLDKITEPVILCGELSAEERQAAARHPQVTLPSPAQCVRRPALLAELAWRRWQAGQQDNAAALAPIYLHVAGTPPA